MQDKGIVHIVDDDAGFRLSLEALLQSAGFTTVGYESGIALLEAAALLTAGCILLDVQMPGMDGLALQARLDALGVRLPVIVMTGHGAVSIAVRAMKAGAVDFIEKPFDDGPLLAAVEAALASGTARASRERAISEAAARLTTLTGREREVLEGIVLGRASKAIAHDLGISLRTVEVHRANMLDRLGTRSVAEAIRLAVMAGLADRH